MATTSSSPRARRPQRPSFTCFGRLPPEIRHIIWQLTLPGSRTFEVGNSFKCSNIVAPCKNSRPSNRLLKAPTIASVCRESREVAMFSGRWRFMGAQKPDSRDGDGDVDMDNRRPIRDRWTWFDAKTDVLFIHQWFYNTRPSPPGSSGSRSVYSSPSGVYGNVFRGQGSYFYDLRDFCRDVRTICVDTRSLVWQPLPVPNIFAFNLMNRALWPRLETYLFCGDVVYLHLPAKVIRTLDLFAEGRQTALVSIDDLAALARLKALHDTYCRSWTNSYLHHGPPLMEQLVQPLLNRQYAEEQLERLRNVWLHAYYSALPNDAPEVKKSAVFKPEPRPNPNHPCFNHEHPWSREALQKMPDYKLVVAFQLCMARHVETKRQKSAKYLG